MGRTPSSRSLRRWILSAPNLDSLRAKTHILVSDLDPSFLTQMQQRLAGRGFPVTAAGDRGTLEQALSSSGTVLDLLVVDVRLTGSDVCVWVENLRKRLPGLDVIVSTGYLHMENAVASLAAGVFDIVQKPPIWPRVLRTIDLAVEHRAFTSHAPHAPGPSRAAQPAASSPQPAVDVAMAAYEFLMGMVPSFGYVDLLSSGKLGELSQEQRDAVEVARQGLEWARRRIRSCMTTAATDPLCLPVNPEVVEITELIGWAAEMLRPIAYEAGVEITFSPPPPCTLFVDRDRLLVILFSLLHNAVQNTRAGGEVRIAVDEQPQHLAVTVSDDGVGIPQEFRERVFDPFFKVPGTERPSTEGLGLGLACVRLNAVLIEALVEISSGPVQGTCFTLTLPRAPVSAG